MSSGFNFNKIVKWCCSVLTPQSSISDHRRGIPKSKQRMQKIKLKYLPFNGYRGEKRVTQKYEIDSRQSVIKF